jgi:hypothetical protein
MTGAFGAPVSKRRQATISSATCLVDPRTGWDPVELLSRDLDDRELMNVEFAPSEAPSPRDSDGVVGVCSRQSFTVRSHSTFGKWAT